MKMLDGFCRLGVSSFVLALACQESDLPLGHLPGDDDDSPPSSGGHAGAGAAGAGGATPPGGAGTYGPVTSDSIVLLKSGDPAQATPPVLEATDHGVMVAGSSADPETVGVQAFAAGVESEAFVGHLTVDGFTWSKPLLSSGLPDAIAATPTGSFVIEGPYLPDEARVSTLDVSAARVLYGIDAAGAIAYDSRLTFDVSTVGTSVAVGADGSIFVGGGAEISSPFILGTKRAFVVKCSSQGIRIWERSFVPVEEPFSSAVSALAVLSNGDIVAGGNFDVPNRPPSSGTGDALGAIVRLTPDGDQVWSIHARAEELTNIGALLALDDGEFLVAGTAVSDFVLGDHAVDVPERSPEDDVLASFNTFTARIGNDGRVRWVTVDPDSYWPRAITRDDRGTGFIALQPSLAAQAERVYLRSFDLESGAVRQSFRTSGSDYTFASSVSWKNGRLWIAGAYRGGPVDFGGGATYAANAAGVFVAHLDPQ